MGTLTRFVMNFGGVKPRKEKLEGRDHYVVPAAMMEEGVWAGNHGPIFYPAEELAAACPSWNYKPIVAAYHPEDADGNKISACQPNILNTRKCGVLLNTGYDTKQRTECWFDIERTKQIDTRIIKKIEASEQIECSTGVIVDNDGVPGTWNGKEHGGTARNHRPDHLAVMPDQVGAYSIQDGGGVMTVNVAKREVGRIQTMLHKTLEHVLNAAGVELVDNELSFGTTTRQLADLLSEKFGKPGKYWDGYILDTFSDKVLFCAPAEGVRDRTRVIAYATKDDTVSLVGEAEDVERVVEYRSKSNVVAVGNSATTAKGKVMALDRKAHIDGLIGKGFLEEDRAELEKMGDVALEKIKPVAAAPVGNATPPVVKPVEVKPPTLQDELAAILAKYSPIQTPAPTTNTAPAGKLATFEEIVANSSPEIQADLKTAFSMAANWRQHETAEKDKVIARITAHARNKFTKEFLGQKGLAELQGMALLLPDDGLRLHAPPMFNLAAGVGGDEITGNAAPEEALVSPAMEDMKSSAG